jgi:uncharacterized LabA/DUF88 family protein
MTSNRPEPEARIALLIDADNSPAKKIDVILAELAKFGVANIRRAYGNWTKRELKGWEDALHAYAIRPVQQFDYSKGKNATDMVMVIEALDLLYTDRPDAFGIVSSDADFTPLVMHLRAKGAAVYGFGAKKTPEPFVNACSTFLFLETLGVPEPEATTAKRAPATSRRGAKAAEKAEAEPAPNGHAAATPVAGRQDTGTLKQDARLVNLLRNSVEAAAGEDGWSMHGSVGKQIGNQASFDPRNYGYATLTKLLKATELFQLDKEGTSEVSVRDVRQARAAPKG